MLKFALINRSRFRVDECRGFMAGSDIPSSTYASKNSVRYEPANFSPEPGKPFM
jgi:hypothetical protein